MGLKLGKYFQPLFFLFLFTVSLCLSLWLHRDTGNFSFRSEIWADRAGYYVYLPATVIYHFDYDKFPENIDGKTGYGFNLNPVTRKVETIYTCGVALMISPFFLATLLLSEAFHFAQAGGFSVHFHRMVDFSAVFYMVFGLLLLFLVLRRYFRPFIGYLVVFFLWAGTNLFYYGIKDPLMSHVYSFFLLSLFLWSLEAWLDSGKFRFFLLLAFAAALATLIRPTNILIYGFLLLWNVGSFQAFTRRVRLLFTLKNILAVAVILFLVLIPQMLYWKYLSGKYIYYSYSGYTFTNWSHPRLAEVWFSTLNGLFIYSPLYLVLIAGIIYTIIARKPNGILAGVYFLGVSYICAAWCCWYFGCSYGQRSFIDYLPLFAVPFGFMADRIWNSVREMPKGIFLALLLAFSYYNVRMIQYWDACFFGSVWDWDQFAVQAEWAGVWKRPAGQVTVLNDFENTALAEASGSLLTEKSAWSGSSSGQLDRTHLFCGKSGIYRWGFGTDTPETADVTIRVYNPTDSATGGQVVCATEHAGRVVSSQSAGLDPREISPGKWYEVKKRFRLAPMNDWRDRVTVYVWNPGKTLFYVDDLRVVFR